MIFKRLLFFWFILPMPLYGQGIQLSYLTEPIPIDSLDKPNFKTHSSFQPILKYSPLNPKTIQVSPIIDLVGGQHNSEWFARTSLGVQNEFFFGKWFSRVGYNYSYFNEDTSYLSSRSLFSRENHAHNVLGRIAYAPNHIFNFQAGVDRNFIGEGCRSLLLSDYGRPYPFAQIRANFWHVEYTTQYQFFHESADNQQGLSKFAASHFISWNVLENWNVGVFETVLFRPRDTLLQRGFEIEYLNPLIFYRPQEYALGSSDNVLLGLSSSVKWNKTVFYGQFILDEFLLSEIRARSGWWGNKYGFQLGAKGHLNFKRIPLFWRMEANTVRPYTYSHINSAQNYGNRGFALAHPYGANFAELLTELKLNYKSCLFKVFLSGGFQGDNSNNLNYGGDIYLPYINRPEDYNNSIGQGKKRTLLRFQLLASYPLKKTQINLFTEFNFRYDSGIGSNFMPLLGVRKALWNDYRNY